MTREEMMLQQVWSNAFGHVVDWEIGFMIDVSLPAEVVKQISGPADIAAALDCWRNIMVARIDEVVRDYKAKVGAAT